MNTDHMKIMRERVILSNFWHMPQIRCQILWHKADAPQGGITMSIDMDDFIQAVLEEIKHPAKVWTKAQQGDAVKAAIDAALEKIKLSSTQAIVP